MHLEEYDQVIKEQEEIMDMYAKESVGLDINKPLGIIGDIFKFIESCETVPLLEGRIVGAIQILSCVAMHNLRRGYKGQNPQNTENTPHRTLRVASTLRFLPKCNNHLSIPRRWLVFSDPDRDIHNVLAVG